MTNLNDYFDRARRETPPLGKDEVSNILAEKLSERRDREDAHARGNGVWWRSIGRVFLTLPPKGWIMISVLLTSAVVGLLLFWQTTPQSAQNEASASQTLRTAQSPPQAAVTTSVSQTKIASKNQTEPNYTPKTQAPKKPQALTTVSAQTLNDSLPAPYDYVPVDEAPQVDMKDLMKRVIYPQDAEKLGLEGKVTVRALLMPDKSISPRSFVEFSDGMKFDSPALKAVFAAEWTPAKRNGKAVPCWVSVPVHFRLPERLGKKAVTNAQILALTSDELKKIGVEQDAKGVVTMLGWNKSRENLYRLQTSIHSDITPKLMDDSVFAEYLHTLRKQGKYTSAANWEIAQFEAGRRALQDLVQDSVINSNKSGIANIVSTKQPGKVVNYAELRALARQFSLPRLVTDGHNYRYFVDMSDLPSLRKSRIFRNVAKTYFEKLRAMNLDSAQILDSVRNFFAKNNSPTFNAMKATKDSSEYKRLFTQFQQEIEQSRLRDEQKEREFEQEKSDISKLIGIRIPCAKALAEGDEYLLWYEPTPEFITLLPERYRTGLEREVAAAKKYATLCEIPTEEEKKAIPGYFDSWRSCDGVLKIASIFPNPANINATVRFTLAEARSVTITVHNLNGDRLAILEPTPVLPAGEHELPLDFTGRNVGVYLLALSTDKNETAIKRVIISR